MKAYNVHARLGRCDGFLMLPTALQGQIVEQVQSMLAASGDGHVWLKCDGCGKDMRSHDRMGHCPAPGDGQGAVSQDDLDYENEHPAAKRMRLEFEAKYGRFSPLMRAANHWFNVRTQWNEAWNRDREQPITESDVAEAERAMLAAAPSTATAAREQETIEEIAQRAGALVTLKDGSYGNVQAGSVIFTPSEWQSFCASLASRSEAPVAPSAEEPSEKQKKLYDLADRIDHEQLWRVAGIDHSKFTPEQKDRLNAGVALRRYGQLLAPGRWLVFPPEGNVHFGAGTLDAVYEMAKNKY